MGLYNQIVKRFQNFGSFRKIDEAPGTSTSGGGGVSRDPLQTIVRKIGLALGVGQNRNEFMPPEFDLTEITTAYDTEAYVRQAIDKYIELMFKAGWDVIGENEAAVEYIRLRLTLMAEMTQVPTDQLFIEIAEDLVKYSNAVIAKARDKQNLLGSTGAPLNVQGLGGQPPIVGYFPLNMTTLAVRRDRNGRIRSWQQEVEGEDRPQRFRPEDIVHMYYKREKGRAFGTPFLLAALDDIRALRQAEENVLRLIYRNLNPLLHIQVGTPEMPGTEPEIQTVQQEFESMELEAGFVTSERVKLNAVASDQIIDAKEYLKYFEQRVFTGLGVSELLMGRGATANRSTGDNLSAEFIDRVKAFQKVMAIFVDEFMIKELLMEGGFDSVINPQDNVDFVFKEIDIDAKIKAENHAVFLYEHNAFTEDEMRTKLGREPITDRGLMHLELVTIPTIKAKDVATGTPEGNNRNEPTNQRQADEHELITEYAHDHDHLKDASEFKRLYFTHMEDTFEQSHEAVVKLIGEYLETEDDERLNELQAVIRYTEEDLVQTMHHYLGIDYAKGYTRHMNKLCDRLYIELTDTVMTMSGEDKETVIYETIGGIYQVLTYRVNDIASHAYTQYTDRKEVERI